MSPTPEREVAAVDALGVAWANAESMLGEHWRIRSLTEMKRGWEVVATDGRRIRTATGTTPLAALVSLAVETVVPETARVMAALSRQAEKETA